MTQPQTTYPDPADNFGVEWKQNKTGQVATNEDVLMGENEELESPDMEDEDTEHENGDDEGSLKLKIAKKEAVEKTNVTELSPISTQVTDLSKGRPISGLQVSLYKLIDGKWTYVNEGITNATGSFSEFLKKGDFIPGRYKLHYDIDRYFNAKKQKSVFPFIETVFNCPTYSDSHIHLLLGPYGYTTFKS